jgi:lysophospholipase L1-like esterase
MPQGKFLAEHYSDGIHPSVRGYDMWAEEMIRFFFKENK